MNDNTGKLILRLTLGILILLHGVYKLMNGIDWLGPALEASGLPAFFQYGVYVGEVVAPVLLILGFYGRIGAWLIAVNMLFAIGVVHWGQLFTLNPQSGGHALEAQYMFIFAAIALALLGPGRFAINNR